MGMGSVLTHYAARGVRVHLVCATPGQKGFRTHTGITDPVELAAVRREELRRVCEILHIEPPMLLDFVDKEVLGPQQGELRERLQEILLRLRPDVVLSFGPDGITGHPDHRGISCLVTELLQKEERSDVRLYFLVFTAAMARRLFQATGRELAWVADRFVNTVIEVTDEELNRSLEAISQYKSQFAPDAMQQLLDFHRQSGREIYFRRALQVVEPGSPIHSCLFGD
jgi:LmbE family N-acetylglucosaminyl deacetylase